MVLDIFLQLEIKKTKVIQKIKTHLSLIVLINSMLFIEN